MKDQLLDLCESADVFHEICENQGSDVDGVHVLAKVRGPAFFPNTVSGNNVYYPAEAWKNAINDPTFQRRLKDRLVLGTIGHNQVMDDDAVKNGLFSHIVTNVYLDHNTGQGIAEYLVLNTPTGKILNTLVRVKSKIRVSTKCRGKLLSNSSGPNGSQSVDPSVFKMERIDFVTVPGYFEALPSLIESQNDAIASNPEQTMSNTNPALDPMVAHVIEESLANFKVDAETKNKMIQSLNESVSSHLRKEVELTESLKTAQATIDSLQNKTTELEESLNAFSELGSAEDIDEALSKADATISKLKSELDRAREDICESLLASELQEQLAAYKELGSAEELEKIMESANDLADKWQEQRIKTIAAEQEVSEDLVTKMLDKGMTLNDISESLSEMRSEFAKSTPRHSSGSPNTTGYRTARQKNPGSTDINEDQNKPASGLAAKLLNV